MWGAVVEQSAKSTFEAENSQFSDFLASSFLFKSVVAFEVNVESDL